MSTQHPSRRSRWEKAYVQVRAIATELGRLPRLSDGVAPDLVHWSANQRRATTLSPRQKAALEALPGWSWDPRGDEWVTRADELRNFIKTHERLPRERDPKESALAHWCSRQRVAIRNGRLSAERRASFLYALGTIDPNGAAPDLHLE